MNTKFLFLVSVCLFLFAFSIQSEEKATETNPFFSEFDTPFGVPPFDKIKEEHYLPAFKEAMAQQSSNIEAIVDIPEPPTFENTIVALENSGTMLRTVGNVFGVLNGSMTNEKMQAIAKEVAPLRSKHRDDIRLNEKLFQRIKAIYDQKDNLSLSTEQNMLLEKHYKDFVRGGANLKEEDKTKFREINQELSVLTVRFGENVLKENNRFEMIIEKEEDLSGLPKAVMATAAETAKERGHEGKWVFTLHKPSMIPFITNNGNFSKPIGDTPALLSSEEVLTLFHEFGHALHGLVSDCAYYRLSGTSVARDFVELPSQIMENWAFEPEVLKVYAKHYKTGEVIPQELIDKLNAARHFNQGFATVEYLAASFLDMDWHTLSEAKELDVEKFEAESLNKIGLIPEIIVRYKSPYFRHVFSGGYSSGYYSYIWAEVLDADAFEAFKATSLFDQKTARAFRTNVLERGGTEDPMTLYKRFRGAEPKVEPLLKKRGLK